MELDGLPSTVMPPTAVTFDLLTSSVCLMRRYIHDPIFGENIYKDTVFTRFFGLLPAVTLIFDLCPQKLISTSTNPNTSVTKIA